MIDVCLIMLTGIRCHKDKFYHLKGVYGVFGEVETSVTSQPFGKTCCSISFLFKSDLPSWRYASACCLASGNANDLFSSMLLSDPSSICLLQGHFYIVKLLYIPRYPRRGHVRSRAVTWMLYGCSNTPGHQPLLAENKGQGIAGILKFRDRLKILHTKALH